MSEFDIRDLRPNDGAELDRAIQTAVGLAQQGLFDDANLLVNAKVFQLRGRYYYAGQKYGWLRYPDKEKSVSPIPEEVA